MTIKLDPYDIERQRDWSFKTFGPGVRLQGVLSHIFKELIEIGGTELMMGVVEDWLIKGMSVPDEGAPKDPSEWADLIILAIDGAMRQGIEPAKLIGAYHVKMDANMNGREWPDWRDFSEDEAIEHVREE